YWFRPNAGQCPSDQAARSDAAAGWLACDEATMGDAELLTESPSIAGHFFSRRLRFLGPQDGSPDRARPVSLRIGWRRSVLAIVLGYLLFSHGCHGDEDVEPLAKANRGPQAHAHSRAARDYFGRGTSMANG